MKKFLKNAYAIVLSALCAAAFILLLVRAEDKIIYPLIGGVAGLLLAPFFMRRGMRFCENKRFPRGVSEIFRV